MKKIIWIGIFLGMANMLLAQPISLTWGKRSVYSEYRSFNERIKIFNYKTQWDDNSRVLGYEKDGLFVMHYDRASVVLERYNKNFQIINNVRYILPSFVDEFTADDLVITKNKIFLFNSAQFIYFNKRIFLVVSTKNIKTNEDYYFVQNIDKETLGKSGVPLRIGKTGRGFSDGYFEYHISKDSSKMLIYNQLPFAEEGPELLSLRVCDVHMNLLWEKNIELPYKSKLTEIVNVKVNNRGEVIVLARIYNKKLKYSLKGRPNYDYVLFKFSGNKEPQEYKLPNGDYFLSYLDFDILNNKEVVCAGFFAKNNARRIAGSAYYRVDMSEQKIVKRRLASFDNEFLKSFRALKKAKKGKELMWYSLDHLVLRSDGGTLLIGEKRYDNLTSNGRYFHYHDIIMTNLNADGSIAWTKRIPKRQIDQLGDFSSYSVSIDRDEIFILFNDHRKNMEDDLKYIRRFRYTYPFNVASVIRVGADGSEARKMLYEVNQKNLFIRPLASKQIDKNKTLIFAEDEDARYYQFGVLEF